MCAAAAATAIDLCASVTDGPPSVSPVRSQPDLVCWRGYRAPSAPSREHTSAPRHDPSLGTFAYAGLGLVLVAYLVSLLVRGPTQSIPLLDGWGVSAFELVASGLCLWRALTSRRRVVPLLLGLGILSWTLGDAVLAAESAGGATPPVPSFADLFYLGFYPSSMSLWCS